MDGHLQGVEGEVGSQRRRNLPADDEPAEDVEHESHVDEADVGLHVGEVGHPEAVGAIGDEASLDEVRRTILCLVGDGGASPLPSAPHAAQPQIAHEALNGAAGHRGALPIELGPDLVRPIDAAVLGVHPVDLGLQGLVTPTPGADGASPRGVVGGGSELQHRADRLDSPQQPIGTGAVPMGIDEAHYLFG